MNIETNYGWRTWDNNSSESSLLLLVKYELGKLKFLCKPIQDTDYSITISYLEFITSYNKK